VALGLFWLFFAEGVFAAFGKEIVMPASAENTKGFLFPLTLFLTLTVVGVFGHV